MFYFLPTIIWRHKKENLKKCSLSGLESRPDLLFFRYPDPVAMPLDNYLLLSTEGKILGEEDRTKGLFLIDGTWRFASLMEKQLPADMPRRSLPFDFTTAYPRRQTACRSPERGLASIEALFIAHFMLNRKTEGLLNNYCCKELFLQKNYHAFEKLAYAKVFTCTGSNKP